MALKLFATHLEGGDVQSVEHGLNTTDLLIQVWQNGYAVTPNIYTVDENTIMVYAIVGSATIVIAGDSPPQVKRSEAKKNGEEAESSKSDRGSRTSGSAKGRSAGSGS